MRHSVSRDLHRYWDELRAGRTAPERHEIDPASIRHILAYTFILEVSPSAATVHRVVTFRLSGTRLNALFQRDLRACDFTSIWTREHVGDAEAMLDIALDDRTAAIASVRGSPTECHPIELELLLLPLRQHGGSQARVLGSLAASSGPSWMGLRPVEPLALTSVRAVMGRLPRDGSTPFGRQPPETPPGDRPSGPRSGDAPKVGSFRVYEGGRNLAARSLREI